MPLTPQGTEFFGPIGPSKSQGPIAVEDFGAEYIAASIIAPTPAISNPDNLHDEDPATVASITNTGNNSWVLDLGSIKERPLKAKVGQFRSPPQGNVEWWLEYSDDNSIWTQGDTTDNAGTGFHLMDAGTVSFRYCRCRSVIDFATWNTQVHMGTTNA